MKFQLDQAIEMLSATPGVLRAMLGQVSGSWARSNYGPDTFSPFDVVGHLIHGEKTDWMPRVRMILEHGETRTFEPFDRYAMFEESRGKVMGQLLEEFARLRNENLRELAALELTESQFGMRGNHPALGPVTMGNLLATWVVHDLNHVAQIAKAMAFQYRESVGPWSAHLSILRGLGETESP